MSIGAIQQAVAGVREFLLAHPEEGRGADSQATALLPQAQKIDFGSFF
jgi:hypothetical protein